MNLKKIYDASNNFSLRVVKGSDLDDYLSRQGWPYMSFPAEEVNVYSVNDPVDQVHFYSDVFWHDARLGGDGEEVRKFLDEFNKYEAYARDELLYSEGMYPEIDDSKRVKDTENSPETISEVLDYAGVMPDYILGMLDTLLEQDRKDELMQLISERFDIAESLDDNIEDYCTGMDLDLERVVRFLSSKLTQGENEYVADEILVIH